MSTDGSSHRAVVLEAACVGAQTRAAQRCRRKGRPLVLIHGRVCCPVEIAEFLLFPDLEVQSEFLVAQQLPPVDEQDTRNQQQPGHGGQRRLP
jgi:hypothetical protein